MTKLTTLTAAASDLAPIFAANEFFDLYDKLSPINSDVRINEKFDVSKNQTGRY